MDKADKDKIDKRTLIREAAFVLIFEKIFMEDTACDDIVSAAKQSGIFCLKNSAESDESAEGEENTPDGDNDNDEENYPEESDFDNTAVKLFKGVYDNLSEIDGIISHYSSKRQINRISKVCLAVLRLTIYELKYNEADVPENVAISEGVNLARAYGLDSEVKFVNGVLGNYSRDTKKGE